MRPKKDNRQVIALTLQGRQLAAVQLRFDRDDPIVEKAVTTAPEPDSATLKSALSLLRNKHDFSADAQIVVSAPPEALYFNKMEQEDPADSHAGRFPIAPSCLAAYELNARRKPSTTPGLTMCVNQSILKTTFSEWSDPSGSLHCDPGLLGLLELACLDNPQAFEPYGFLVDLQSERCQIALLQNRRILSVRSMPIVTSMIQEAAEAGWLIRELELIWRSLTGQVLPASMNLTLSCSSQVRFDPSGALRDGLMCRVMPLTVPAAVDISMLDRALKPEEFAVLGMALRSRKCQIGRRINLLSQPVTGQQPGSGLQQRIIAAGLILGIAALNLMGMGLRINRLQGSHDTLKEQTREAYMASFPEETQVIKPLDQAMAHLRALQEDLSDLSRHPSTHTPLTILGLLQERAPLPSSAQMNFFSVVDDQVSMQVHCASAGDLREWFDRLDKVKQFEDVQASPESDDRTDDDPPVVVHWRVRGTTQ